MGTMRAAHGACAARAEPPGTEPKPATARWLRSQGEDPPGSSAPAGKRQAWLELPSDRKRRRTGGASKGPEGLAKGPAGSSPAGGAGCAAQVQETAARVLTGAAASADTSGAPPLPGSLASISQIIEELAADGESPQLPEVASAPMLAKPLAEAATVSAAAVSASEQQPRAGQVC